MILTYTHEKMEIQYLILSIVIYSNKIFYSINSAYFTV